MKKLMTMIAAVATCFGLYATDAADPGFVSGTNFNGIAAGDFASLQAAEPDLWEYSGAAGNESTVIETGCTVSDMTLIPAQYVMDYEAGNSLKVQTPATNAVWRKCGTIDGDSYVDFSAEFTVFDEDPEIDDTEAKLAIWLQEELEGEDVVGTNVWLRAGKVGGAPQNYNCGSVDKYEIGAWNRVTVKAIDDITTGFGTPGFAAFINKIALNVADKRDYDIGMTDGFALKAKQWYDANALFPSISGEANIKGLGVAGKGGIDNIAFTTAAPNFAKDWTYKTVAWDAGVTGFTCGDFTTNGLTAAGSVFFRYEGEKPMVTAASVTYADGKMAKDITPDQYNDETITSQDAGATLTIGGETKSYATAAEAIAYLNDLKAETSAALKLNADAAGFQLDNENVTLVLDLAGKDVTGAENEAAIDAKTGTLTVTNSTDVVGSVIAVGATGVAAKSVDDGTLIITAGIIEGAVQSESADCVTISGGRFLASANEGLAEKATIVPTGSTLIPDGETGYLIVGIPAPTTGTVIFICEKNSYTNEVADQEATVVIATIAPTAAEVEGSTLYTFDGWFKDQACTEAIADMTVPAGETTYIYARAKDPATLTFTTTIGTAPQAVTVKLGSAWGTAPVMADAENIFNGWAKEGEVVAADFWTTPVEASDEVAADWTPAGATAGGVAYATIKAALEAPASSNQTVKFLADIVQADALASVKTSAATIDFNGKNVAITAITYAGDAETFTVQNGENGQYAAKTITVPAGVNLTIDGMTAYGQTTVKGGDNAILAVKDNYFSDLYDAKGNTIVPTNKTDYASYCVTLSGAFARADITGNTFCQMVRAGISGGDTATTMFVYDNLFLGRKNCMTPAQKDERYAAMQIAKANKVYMENNVYSNENFGADLGMVQGAIRVDDANVGAMVFSGNLFADGDIYFWNRRGGDSVTKNVFYGLNEATEEDFLWGNGIKAADISTVVPAYTPGTDPLALPEGVDSIYAWLHGENAEMPYVVNNKYYAELPELKADDVIIVEPTLANDFAITSETLALENVTVDEQVKANMFKVIEKPQAVTIAVSLQNVKSVKYDGQVKTAGFDIADVAKGSTITISDIVADDQYEVSVACSKDITDNGDGTFTVAADLSSPNATIEFVGTPMLAVAYTIADDTIVGRYDINNISDAWTMAKDGVHYIKMFGNWAKSTSENDLAVDAVCRINNDGDYKIQVKAATGYPVASITRDANDKFDIYTPYATLQAAVDAEANATEMFVTGAAVDLSTLTLTVAKNTFKGHFGDGVYTAITGSFKAETELTLLGVAKTSTWGAEGKTFAFVAEAIDYTVTFAKGDADGGTDVAAITFNYGDAKTAPECTWTYTGHEFVAWTNLVDGGAAIAAGAALPTEVEAGYTLTAVWAEKSTPGVAPGGSPVNVEAKDEAEAISKVPQVEVDPPAGADVSKTDYNAYFVKKAADLGDGTFNVYLDLKPEIVQAAKETESLGSQLTDIASATEGPVDVTVTNAKPGLYYSVIEGQQLTGRTEGEKTLATGTSVTIKTTKFANSGFYQINVSASAGLTE